MSRHNDAVRLDQAIAARFPDISRRKARQLLAEQKVLVNERPVSVASREVSAGDRIRIIEGAPEIAVLGETDEWVAVDKPAGMPTQPTRDRAQLSLEEILRARYRQIYLVHRLDTPTSGVVLFARTRKAAAKLSELFASGAIRKTYLAVIDGSIEKTTSISTPIEGRDAVSIIRPLRGSTVEVEIKTGRTHQIRVHLASIGYPVVGDRRYGGPPASRLMLHAWKLEHPEIGTVEAPAPF